MAIWSAKTEDKVAFQRLTHRSSEPTFCGRLAQFIERPLSRFTTASLWPDVASYASIALPTGECEERGTKHKGADQQDDWYAYSKPDHQSSLPLEMVVDALGDVSGDCFVVGLVRIVQEVLSQRFI